MCGIVGYIGKNNGVNTVIDGLKALEYRGYDSAGISILSGANKPITIKQVGRVEKLESELTGSLSLSTSNHCVAIGHTRWATHGSPTVNNAHPHFNQDKTIFVVHNGIVENYLEIKNDLINKGYKFVSDTDTEVIPQLLGFNLINSKSPLQAFEKTIKSLDGAYAIAAIFEQDPDNLYVARLSSPLVIGIGKDENYISSDPSAIANKTKKVIYLDDYEIAVLSNNKCKVRNIKKAVDVERKAESLDEDFQQSKLGDYPHFMLKEINEIPQTIQSATLGRIKLDTNTVKLGGLESVSEQLRYIDRIIIVACGTSYYAGLVGEYLIEELAGIPVEVELASEFKYRKEPFSRSTAIIAVSQSGETADTIAALKKVEGFGMLRLGIVNAPGSTIARMTDAGVYCHAGPEQSVASTKAFIAQVSVLSLIALHLSNGKTPIYRDMLKELLELPDKAKEVLEQAEQIKKLAKKYAKYRDFLFIGRNYGYPCALEGALKLKEISYIHAEGYGAGEMKHGPLAMISSEFPTFVIANKSAVSDKVYSNVEEIKARKGPVIAVGTKGDKKIVELVDDVVYIPKTLDQTLPLLAAIVLQLFAYYVSIELGNNVDRPRNLAKSVTVE